MVNPIQPDQELRVYKQIFELAPIALLVVDSRGRIRLFNDNAEQLFGYSASEVLEAPVEILIGSKLRAQHMNFVKEYFANPTPRSMGDGRNLFAVHKDGHEFPIEVGLKPMPAEADTLVMASIIDITRRINLEARFRTAIEAAPIAMTIVDAERKIVTINKVARTLFGYDEQEILGKDVELLVPEEVRAGHPRLVEKYLQAPTPRQMGQGRRLFGIDKRGRRIPIEVGLSPIQTEDGVYVVTSIIDITRQLGDEKRFRDVVEAAPNAMLIVDEGGLITLVNEQCQLLFQYAKEELIGQPVAMLVPDSMREVHKHHTEKYIRAPEPRSMGKGRDLFGQRKDGTRFPVEVGLRPMTSESGISIISSIVDISERLAHKKMLLDRNQELQQFAYRASHDLRAPLISIGGMAELLQHRALPSGDEVMLSSIERIRSLAAKLCSFVDDILTLTRADHLDTPLCPYDFEEGLATIRERLHHLITESNVDVQLVQTHSCAFETNATRVSQILENLVSNAMKYCSPDEPARRVQVLTFNDPTHLYINVSDNGIGIGPEHHASVFQMFKRFHPSSTTGSGLGLYLVHKHVEQLGGTITFESAPGASTTFYLKFPLGRV